MRGCSGVDRIVVESHGRAMAEGKQLRVRVKRDDGGVDKCQGLDRKRGAAAVRPILKKHEHFPVCLQVAGHSTPGPPSFGGPQRAGGEALRRRHGHAARRRRVRASRPSPSQPATALPSQGSPLTGAACAVRRAAQARRSVSACLSGPLRKGRIFKFRDDVGSRSRARSACGSRVAVFFSESLHKL